MEAIDFSKVKAYLSGSIDEHDRAEVESWISSSPEEFESVKQYLRSEGLTAEQLRKSRIDNWNRIKRDTIDQRKLYRVRRRLTVAAAVVVAFVAGFGVSQWHEELISAPEQANPIAEMIKIETQDGRVFMLGNDKTADPKTRMANAEKGLDYSTGAVNSKLMTPGKTVGKTVEYHKLSIPKGLDFQVKLSDGTVIHLNSNSSIRYPIEFAAKGERRIFLSGEAFFEVAKDPNRRFIVETEGMDVRVYGTRFNVSTYKDGVIETVLVDGAVSIAKTGSNNEVRMEPGQLAVWNRRSEEVAMQTVDVENYVSWRSGVYTFNKMRVEDIFTSLENWFDVRVKYADESIKDKCVTARLPRYENIEELLYYLEKAAVLNWRKENDCIVLY